MRKVKKEQFLSNKSSLEDTRNIKKKIYFWVLLNKGDNLHYVISRMFKIFFILSHGVIKETNFLWFVLIVSRKSRENINYLIVIYWKRLFSNVLNKILLTSWSDCWDFLKRFKLASIFILIFVFIFNFCFSFLII